MPRMTTAERTAIATPANGLQVYDTTTNSQWYYNGTAWVQGGTTAASSKWTNDATNTRVALTNLSDGVTARPAGKEFVITDSGKVGIGTTSPVVSLVIESSTSNRPWLLLNNTSGTNNNCGITFRGSASEFNIFEWSAGQNLHFSSNFNTNTDIFRLFKEGNVAVYKNLYVGSPGIATSAAARLIVVRTALTGTIASVGTTVTGTGTNFTTAFAVGDQIVVNGEVKTISSITSNTELIINTAFTSDLPSGTAYDSVNAVFLTGNVGIGTTTPTEKLEVAGAIKIGTTTTATSTAGTIRFNTTTNKFEGYDGSAWVAFH